MLAIALMGYAGFVGLCLGMDKHFTELLGRKPRAAQCKVLRIGGWALLLVSLLLALRGPDLALALVQWIAVLMAAVSLWVFGLAYLPRLLLGLAALSLVLGPLLAVLAG